uniref:PI-PLC X domain-containing protein 3 n=2 Tax=Lygus hesperus TaxID=30085 RepID=A0A0A9X7M8_LYGHE
MADNWESIKSLKLSQVFLPGCHNAGSYQLAYTPFEPNMLDKYVFTQDESVLEQLIHGSRYLDFRIGRYSRVKSLVDLIIQPQESEFWLNHDFVQVNKLLTVLKEINLFLNNTQEIVVVDVHAFPVGFKKRMKSHVELLEYFKLHLGDHLASYTGYETTLEQVRATGKRLILAYNRVSIVHLHYSSVWRPISQKWGDVRSVEDLHKFITRTMSKPHLSGMSAVMAELTPTAWELITDELGGLRTMMDTCNHNVTDWFRDKWGLTTNAVAVDFIRSTGIVSAAIRWNNAKAALLRSIGNETDKIFLANSTSTINELT